MYRIGLILGPVVFFGAVLEWILRLTHYVELIEKALPWVGNMTGPSGIWVTMVVGILIFVAAWAERKKEKDEVRKRKERESDDRPPPSQLPHHSVGNIDQKANPVNTVDASQKVEIHNHPPIALHKPARPVPPLPAAPVPHNVQFMGVKKIQTDISREIFDATEGFVGVQACFLNKIIPGSKISDFDYVHARVVFRDESGAVVAEIATPKWLDHEPHDSIHVNANQTGCILLAVFGGDDEWTAPLIVDSPSNYWDDGTCRLMVDGRPLPSGEFSAEITLVGEDNIGLHPVIAHFSLGPRGEVEIKQQ